MTSILHLCTFSSLIKGFYHRCCPLFRQIRLEVFWELTCLLDQSTDSQASYCYNYLFVSCPGFHLHFPLKFDCIHQDQAFPSSCLVYNPKRHQFLLVQCLTLVSRWPPLNFISLLVWEDAQYSILASFVREFLIWYRLGPIPDQNWCFHRLRWFFWVWDLPLANWVVDSIGPTCSMHLVYYSFYLHS